MSAGLATASGLPEAAAFQHPAVAETAHAVSDWNLVSGNLSLHFDNGSAAYLLVGGKPAGIYVKGKGSFRYLAKDPVMKATMLFNLAENKGITPVPEGDALVLGEPLTEGVIWFAGREIPKLEGAAQPPLAEAYGETAAMFAQRNHRGYLSGPELLNRPPLDHLMAYRTLNACPQSLCTAELVGARDRYVYTYDPFCGKLESLFVQRPANSDPERSETAVLVADPLGWQRAIPPDPDFRLAHLDLDLEASRRTSARMTVTETISVLRPGLRCLRFHFTDHRWSWTSSGTGTALKTSIHKVRLENGTDLPFDVKGGYLLVDLGHAGRNGETVKITFEIQGDFLGNESEGTFDYWRLQPGTHWFPEPDDAGQGYSVKARVAVEKPYMPIVSARTLSRTSTATHNVVEAVQDLPICAFSVAGGKYDPLEMVKNNRTVRAWCYAGVPSTCDMLLKTTHAILEFYDKALGGVPFDEINLVEVPSLGAGQAPAGMIWLTREAFDPRSDTLTRAIGRYGAVTGWTNRMVAHELAHQYWGHRVKTFSEADNWISESFAEYSSALVIKAMKGMKADSYDLIVADWKRQGTAAASRGTIPTAQYMQPRVSDLQSMGTVFKQSLLYAKGPYLLACLHQELGDQAFFRFLRIYQAKLAWYPPSYTQDVVDILKAVSGKDYTAWMNEFFWGTAMPELKK